MAASVVYTTFGGQIVSENRGGTKRDYIPDTLGSTIALVDDSQTVSDTWEYWPYGEVKSHTGSSTTPFTFVGTLGYFNDAVSSLTYVRARFYNAFIGHWMTVDGLWPTSAAYVYVRQRPVSFVAPSRFTSDWPMSMEICAAFICSGQWTVDLLSSLIGVSKARKLLDIPKTWSDAKVRDLINKTFKIGCEDPKDCLKDVLKRPPATLLGKLYQKICADFFGLGEKPPAYKCRDLIDETTKEVGDCCRCCETIEGITDGSWFERRCKSLCIKAGATQDDWTANKEC